MAILTDDQITIMWRSIFQIGSGKSNFKGANPSLSGEDLKDTFQAIEDFWETNKITLKGQMDTAAGVTLTNNQAKVLGRAWLMLKARRGN